MRARQAGMILLLTLLLLMLVSTFVLVQLRGVWLFAKSQALLENRHQLFYQMQAVGLSLIQDPPSCNKPECLMNYAGKSYTYRVEDLGKDDCLLIATKSGLRSSLHTQYRIKLEDALLQLHMATAVKGKPCMGETHIISPGLVNWYYKLHYFESGQKGRF